MLSPVVFATHNPLTPPIYKVTLENLAKNKLNFPLAPVYSPPQSMAHIPSVGHLERSKAKVRPNGDDWARVVEWSQAGIWFPSPDWAREDILFTFLNRRCWGDTPVMCATSKYCAWFMCIYARLQPTNVVRISSDENIFIIIFNKPAVEFVCFLAAVLKAYLLRHGWQKTDLTLREYNRNLEKALLCGSIRFYGDSMSNKKDLAFFWIPHRFSRLFFCKESLLGSIPSFCLCSLILLTDILF